MIDTHAHLDAEEFNEDLDSVINNAKEAGVEAIFIPGICLKDTPHLLEICNRYPGYLFPMIGLHPENIKDENYNTALDKLEQMLSEGLANKENSPSTPIAVGEVGLDFYWDDSHKKEQMEVFERQIMWAEKYELPLMIHARNAQKELVEMMTTHKNSNLTGVFHCFSGSEQDAKELLNFDGFMLGIGGVSTFKKSNVTDVLKNTVPLNRIVLETDSPYLAPVPNRGKRNESAFITHVATKLADTYDTNLNTIELQTTENVSKVFTKCSFFNKK
ncbi:MAG: TatD family hydrolase [Bacteroidaceae bacterium]|nr:TatD family hydrolase [Bacteroidaceae bacterium]